ncbi:MAG: 30S ribosomal protein S12 methylthiotransferase RimO [Desulfobacterales bacterium]|nr:30S ribosomal protein S12 methylthiotransferase RimO [Desulfobacterales bacterium]
MNIHLVSLGCARNLVDSENMLGRLRCAGWRICDDPEDADVIVVNTCSFVEDAVNESIDTILELSEFRQSGPCKRLIVAGCLPERYRDDILESLPEVDQFLGTGAYDQIVQAAEGTLTQSGCVLPDPDLIDLVNWNYDRVLSTAHMAYLKIAEGCDKHCTYCIIPKLRGHHKSRPTKNIVDEARELIKYGTRELIMVAQDTTAYGHDLFPPAGLGSLVSEIAGIDENVWIRTLYGHPESIDDAFLETVAARPNICSYFDIPIQHTDSGLLKLMGRHYSRDDLYRLYEKIKSTVPDAALRTTVIVGFPGETDKAFEDLIRFIQDVRFDHLGGFIYSDADDLPSHDLKNHVPVKIAQKRYDELMKVQLEISSENMRRYIGNVYDVLIDEKPDDDHFLGRTAFQAPEIDGCVFVRSENIGVGRFTRVKITDALEYDLVGETE